jgi:hypothetical protein
MERGTRVQPSAMTQIFPPSTNTISKVSLFGAVFVLGAAAWAWGAILRSPYVSQVDVVREQPVAFSHRHHVAGLGIDCRYCHGSAEESSFAGIPSTKVCMSCHSQVWTDAPILAPVRESYREDRSIEWTRVHDLPDFAYFHHAIHLKQGIGCSTCHGRVDQMPLMWRASTLHMEWCLECHREPERFVRPRAAIFDMDWDPESITAEQRTALIEEYDVRSNTSCNACHR